MSLSHLSLCLSVCLSVVLCFHMTLHSVKPPWRWGYFLLNDPGVWHVDNWERSSMSHSLGHSLYIKAIKYQNSGGGGGVGLQVYEWEKRVVSCAMCCFSPDLFFKSHFRPFGQSALNYLFLPYFPGSQPVWPVYSPLPLWGPSLGLSWCITNALWKASHGIFPKWSGCQP